MPHTKFYLAYGSNLNLNQMAFRCPGAKIAGMATLDDYRLLFRGSRTGAYLTVEPCKGSQVPVGVWEITEADERALDRYEGYPSFYYKKTLRVTLRSEAFDLDDLQVDALIYIMHEDRPLGVPSRTYLSTCGKGYLDWGFDLDILETALRFVKREAC